MYFTGKDRGPSTTPYCRRYMAAAPFYATFTVLFYFERYIFLDFYCSSRAPRNTLLLPLLRGFIKILYRSRIYERDYVEWKPRGDLPCRSRMEEGSNDDLFRTTIWDYSLNFVALFFFFFLPFWIIWTIIGRRIVGIF